MVSGLPEDEVVSMDSLSRPSFSPMLAPSRSNVPFSRLKYNWGAQQADMSCLIEHEVQLDAN